MLDEIREDEASGETAEIYADIRRTLGVPVVNYIWRHLATIESALPWCWSVIVAASPKIKAALPAVRHLTDELLMRHGLVLPPPQQSAPVEVERVLQSYNRGNSWNFLSLTLLATTRAGVPVDAAQCTDAVPFPSRLDIPSYPRMSDLPFGAQTAVRQLESAGPAAASGVRPSLWVHLGRWPDVLADIELRAVPLLASEPFAHAHSEMLRAAPKLLGLDISPQLESDAPDAEVPQGRAIQLFRFRIAEMVLVGRLLAPGQNGEQHQTSQR